MKKNGLHTLLSLVCLASGLCFVMACLYSREPALAVANAVVFGTSMISLAILSRGDARQIQ